MRIVSELTPYGKPVVMRNGDELVCFLIASYAETLPLGEKGDDVAKIGNRKIVAVYYMVAANGAATILQSWEINGTRGLVMPMANMGPLLSGGYETVDNTNSKKLRKRVKAATDFVLKELRAALCSDEKSISLHELLDTPGMLVVELVKADNDMKRYGFRKGQTYIANKFDVIDGVTIWEITQDNAYMRFAENNPNIRVVRRFSVSGKSLSN